MKSELLTVNFDENTGCINSITINNDENEMNFCRQGGNWGKINFSAQICHTQGGVSFTDDEYVLKSFTQNDSFSKSVYENLRTVVTVTREFDENGYLQETYEIKNNTDTVVCFNRDFFGIEIHPDDEYTYGEECMVKKCNTHIWCGGNCSWVNMLKMGDSPYNLGLMLTKGALLSYSQNDCHTNHRGYFILEPESVMLKKKEKYTLSWTIFVHNGEDFFEKAQQFETYIGVSAEHFTVLGSENISFSLTKPATVTVNGKKVKEIDGKFTYSPKKKGEYRFLIKYGKHYTYADFNAKEDFDSVLDTRIKFMVEHQQCLDKKSPLYGAFLIYDNKTQSQYFDYFNPDHNGCRERLNMILTLAKYLQTHKNEKYLKSFRLFMDFTFREFYEEKTGEVFNTIGKNADMIRLYNAPGVMLLFAEAFRVEKDEKYIRNIVKLADKYYTIGGKKCYSNAVAIKKVVETLKNGGYHSEAEKILGYFNIHVENMIKNGTAYPKHEVNYEQTIVTPTVTCISEMGLFSENKEYYIREATKHIKCLKRFSGHQPSFRLNQIALRYWDDYWFGKGRLFGDTLPHHLSVLTARAYVAHYLLTQKEEYLDKAEENIRNCMCLIEDDGTGHAASIYPRTANGQNGDFFDGWANDQDLVLYEGMYLRDVDKNRL